jgi:hypothetical protein
MENKKITQIKNQNFYIDPYIPKGDKNELRNKNQKKDSTLLENSIGYIASLAGMIGTVYFGNKLNEISKTNELEKIIMELGLVGAFTTCFVSGINYGSKILSNIQNKYKGVKNNKLNKYNL